MGGEQWIVKYLERSGREHIVVLSVKVERETEEEHETLSRQPAPRPSEQQAPPVLVVPSAWPLGRSVHVPLLLPFANLCYCFHSDTCYRVNSVCVEYFYSGTTVTKSSTFWDIRPCSQLNFNLRFVGACRLNLQDRRIGQTRSQWENRWQREQTVWRSFRLRG
jgi:hypothetical protein